MHGVRQKFGFPVRWAFFLLFALGAALWTFQTWIVQAQDGQRQAFLLTIADAISPATGDYLLRGLERAQREGAELLIVQLDTPGGLDSTMRDIVKAQLASTVPVVTYVHPAGARAASAGTYLLYGSHVAAMTPTTHLGSATPVQMGGGGLPGFDSPLPSPGRDAATPRDATTPEVTSDHLPSTAAAPVSASSAAATPSQPVAADPANTPGADATPGFSATITAETTADDLLITADDLPATADDLPVTADDLPVTADDLPVTADDPAATADAPVLAPETTPTDTASPRRGATAMERKVLEDAVAFIRGLAEHFQRNADWAEEAVREGANLNAQQALEQGVIDFVAEDLDDLLRQLDGHTVRVAGGEKVLQTEFLSVVRVDPDWRTQLLAVIASPNIAYILMLVGIYGIIFELSNPGSIYPGVIGTISLVLAFYALQVMPVNYAGLALVLLGLIFMVGEAFLPSFGVLGIGGIIAFITGSIILWDDPALRLSIELVLSTAVIVAGFTFWIMGRLFRLRRITPAIGRREMIGLIGEARESFAHSGRVYVHSERWLADSTVPIRQGQKVRVTGMQGLRLQVEPVE
jgi:membrane-bound serine protease (ClpP class)